MFDIGWTEMAVIALLALIVIGPKDLPKVLRTMGQWVRKARSLTREFQSGLDDMIRESELDEAKKAVETGKNFNVKKAVQDSVDPTGELEEEGKSIEGSAKRGLSEDDLESRSATAEANKTTEASASKGEGETEKRATVVKHPHQPAPGNSVKPPAEEGANSKKTAAGSAGAKSGSSGKAKSGSKSAAKESSG